MALSLDQLLRKILLKLLPPTNASKSLKALILCFWCSANDENEVSAGYDANQPISHICCLILREKHFISFSSPHHRLRGRLVSALPARGRRSLSQRQWWRWWRWWWWTGDWFVPAGTVLVWRIKDALWNEIYFLLLGTIIMPKSIFNILGSMTPRFSFASLLSANQSESREWSGGEVKSNLFRPQRHKQCWPRRALQSAQLWQEKLQKPFREKDKPEEESQMMMAWTSAINPCSL